MYPIENRYIRPLGDVFFIKLSGCSCRLPHKKQMTMSRMGILPVHKKQMTMSGMGILPVLAIAVQEVY
ncbi:MAG TPA: hypothetical protein DCE56_14355 [Cyanobacteria bacterium UBA8553]|nr:hypothetical protein [Cyanobacteria bacterium UBA8553]